MRIIPFQMGLALPNHSRTYISPLSPSHAAITIIIMKTDLIFLELRLKVERGGGGRTRDEQRVENKIIVITSLVFTFSASNLTMAMKGEVKEKLAGIRGGNNNNRTPH